MARAMQVRVAISIVSSSPWAATTARTASSNAARVGASSSRISDRVPSRSDLWPAS